MRRDVEGAYTSAFAIRGPFEDFDAALEHAVSCDEAFRGMARRAAGAPPGAGALFPPPAAENYRALAECWP